MGGVIKLMSLTSAGKLLWRVISDPKTGGAISTISGVFGVVAIVIGVANYIDSEPDQDVVRYSTAWSMLNSHEQNGGQKYAIELLARHHVPMNSVVLTGADLSGIKIRGANLAYANIQRSNFSNADLRDVDFRNATLVNNDFSFANLKGATMNELNFAGSGTGNNANSFTGAILPNGIDVKEFVKIACAIDVGSKGNLPSFDDGQVIAVSECKPPRMQAPCASAWCAHN